MKSISENKLKAFSIGKMNVNKKVLTKRDKEEIKKKEEDIQTEAVYKEFVASFEGSKSEVKTFVRGDIINPDAEMDRKKGKLYKPASRFEQTAPPKKPANLPSTPKLYKPDRPTLKKKDDKRKSNLELFKEELKVIQLEREQRHSVKKHRSALASAISLSPERRPSRPSRFEPVDDSIVDKLSRNPALLDDLVASSQESGDPMTTNLFLGNVNPIMDEQELCEVFGKYGPLASVKVMWPRTDEERSRERNCAFVAFMTRKDADRALRHLQGRMVRDYEMKMGWGKTVPIPPHPVYVPPALLERTMPPPPSGLPFNAQPLDPNKQPKGPGIPPDFIDQQDFENTLKNSLVRVVVPTERNLLGVIHRMIEFVVREGPMFEAMIMHREMNNPMFRFLFENKTPAHVYYRWRLYTILQGETPTKYRQNDFRIFKNGPLWRPPPLNPYSAGLDETDSEDEGVVAAKVAKSDSKNKSENPEDVDKNKGELREEDRDKLEDILRSLLPRQKAIGDAMEFCLDHADSAEEIVECISESLSILETPLTKKIARLYLISDILHNSSAKVANASFFRKHFQAHLEQVMLHLNASHQAISSRLRAEQFKQKVLGCFRAWDDWAVYPDKLLIHFQNAFFGLVPDKPQEKEEDIRSSVDDMDGFVLPAAPSGATLDSIDGDPLETIVQQDSDVDGAPLDGYTIDGMPLETKKSEPEQPRFVQSKWETVDPEDVEAQAMTTSKWDQLESQIDGQPLDDDHATTKNSDSVESKWDEAKRARLREIEVKVMKFQDELESGHRERKSGMSVGKQVEHYRQKLLEREMERDSRDKRGYSESDRRKEKKRTQTSSSDDSSSGSEKARKKKRKRHKDSTPSRRGGGLVAYDSDESNDSMRRRGTAKKSKPRGRSRSRSRERRHSHRRSPSDRRHSSRSPKRSKRSRSRSSDKKKKRKSRR
uniref:U2 snRNP-associated SURP motif-containing protein-like n=1 Tax=Phallusia mammillata TaxID=59560 RepID=A0A6F9DW62_9ASCI|nr:U2 snRNP-associated SURP motif-containing protein-like [Phallusia mammillata]